ncbi:type II toxin-antitoxin system death-on-curing family toxin [bacterium]|nr:type II toxin-antitoxin system death-on-curing family toxin [bacterium]MDY4582476.1 type II toxin-antitoxin system death-on-curing family toxin [Candidatus Faecousia sp.]
MRVLSKRQILMLHSMLVAQSGGADGLRDEGLLESAINTPLQTFGGQELYPTVLEKAARLGYGLIHNHPFLDGNKRIGTHAMLVFLDINNITLSYEDDDLIAAILRVASGEMDDSQLLEWLKTHIE